MAQNHTRSHDRARVRQRHRQHPMKMQSKKKLRGGFTILEVMIAVAVFFIGTFAILALVSQSLDNARRLQRPLVDAGMLASQLSLTNQLVEGTESGDAGDLLGDNYKGY